MFLLALTLAGSAASADSTGSSPPPAAVTEAAQLPGPASPALARIYIYRGIGNYLHPAWAGVWLNDVKVGAAAPGTFFHRDVPSGTYKLTVDTDLPYVDQSRTLTVVANSTTFVRVYVVEGYGISFSGTTVNIPNVFGVNIVEGTVARREIAPLTPAS